MLRIDAGQVTIAARVARNLTRAWRSVNNGAHDAVCVGGLPLPRNPAITLGFCEGPREAMVTRKRNGYVCDELYSFASWLPDNISAAIPLKSGVVLGAKAFSNRIALASVNLAHEALKVNAPMKYGISKKMRGQLS